MLTSLEIENFKCFRHLKIEPLAKVNLIVGTSNVGKTSLLEAISWLPHRPKTLSLTSFRDGSGGGDNQQEYGRWIVNNPDKSNKRVWIVGERNGSQEAELRTWIDPYREAHRKYWVTVGDKPICWEPNDQAQCPQMAIVNTNKMSAQDLARSFDQWTRRSENEDRFVAFLAKIEPKLKSLRPMEQNGTRILFADVRLRERIALPLLGEGFNRLVQIFGSIIGEDADVLLIDEIENGLHWSALPQIWTGIREAVNKEEVQIFATTHSRECIEAAVEVFKGEPKNDLAVHRLERRDDGEIHCVTMGEDELERMLERGWEVR